MISILEIMLFLLFCSDWFGVLVVFKKFLKKVRNVKEYKLLLSWMNF